MSGANVQALVADFAAFAFHIACFVGYRAVQKARARRDPSATLQAQQAALRAQWADEVLRTGSAILGVQTLRNALMASVFFASNTMFLVIGALTLSANEHVGEAWSVFELVGSATPELAQAKVLLLILTLLVSFFCFLGAIRLFSHASISVGTHATTAEQLEAQIDTAWRYQGLGVRCYYFATPILFWMFGTSWFVFADLGALTMMFVFDRIPTGARPD